MSTDPVAAPELKRVVGALVFGSGQPLGVREIRRTLVELAELGQPGAHTFAEVRDRDVRAALDELAGDLERSHAGFSLGEVAGGFRLQSDPACGPWLRHLLKTGRPQRLSQPALETLAIIGYRQPITKAEIEGIRGVNVDHIMRLLMEMQLVRISGRSELPGRPFLYGTTQTFLEHFGLKDLSELADMEPMLAMARLQQSGGRAAPAAGGPPGGAQTGGSPAQAAAVEPAAVPPGGDIPAAPDAGDEAVAAPGSDDGVAEEAPSSP